MEKEYLTNDQLQAVIKLLDKNKNKFFIYALMIIGFLLVISLIPISFLPKSYRLGDDVDKSLNLIQFFGWFWWSVIIGTFSAVFIVAIFADMKILKLNKDIKDKEIISDIFSVKEVLNSSRHSVYAVILTAPSIKKLVRHVGQNQINNFRVGQQFNMKVLKHSHVLINELENDFKLFG